MSRRSVRRPLAVAVSAGLSATLLLAGCGSDPAPSDAVRPAASDRGQQVAASAEDDAVDAELVALLDDLRGAAEQLTTTGFDLAVRGDERVDVTGALDVTTDVPTLRAQVLRPDLGIEEVRVVDGTAYGLVGFPGTRPSWVRVPLPDLSGLAGLAGSADLDPESLAARLGEVVTSVEQTDSATGTTYTAVVDVDEVMSLLTMLAATIEVPGMPDLGSMLGSAPDSAAVPDEVTVTVDLDDAGRLTEVAAEADSGSATLTLTDPGAPVRVTAPARSRDLGSFGFAAPGNG